MTINPMSGLHPDLRWSGEAALGLRLGQGYRLVRRVGNGGLAMHAIDLRLPGLGRLDTILQVLHRLQEPAADLDDRVVGAGQVLILAFGDRAPLGLDERDVLEREGL